MNELVRTPQALPDVPRDEHLSHRVRQLMHKRYAMQPSDYPSAAERLAVIDAVLAEAESLIEELRGRFASRKEIATQLAVPIACYPNSGSADGKIFGRVLVEDVAAANPTVDDLEAACRKLRRTQRFCPAICEVLEALAEAASNRRTLIHKIEGHARTSQAAGPRRRRGTEGRRTPSSTR